MAKPLNDRERRFVDEYMIDLDPKRAALAADYSATMAASKAYQWVSNSKVKPHVFTEIAKRQAAIAQSHGVTADRIVAELAKLGFSNMADYMRAQPAATPTSISRLSRDQAAALVEVTVEDYTEGRGEDEVKRVKFRLADKRAALVDLGKHLGMFGKDGQPVGDTTNNIVQINVDALNAEERQQLRQFLRRTLPAPDGGTPPGT